MRFLFCVNSISFPIKKQGINNILPELQKLGKQGWDLVSVCPTSSSEYGIDMVTVFLKKEIE